MKLTWRDGITTLLAAAVIGLYFAITRGVNVPLIGSQTVAIVVMGVVAVIMGLVGMEQRDVEEEGWFGTLAVAGVVTLGLFVASFFYTTQTMFLAVMIGVVATWGIGMAHHLVSQSDEVGALI